MTVYVDGLKPCVPNENWKCESCHLFADDVEELHAFASKLGLKRMWFQDKPDFPHYDLTKHMRMLAVCRGAVSVDDKDAVDFIRKNRKENED